MRRAAAIVALVLLPARTAAADVLEAWPCAGCTTVTPPSTKEAPPGPRPLLVALHGDGGGVRPLVRAWKAAAAAEGVVLLAPRCPQALGCPAGSWWQWLASSGHDAAWLGAQIDAVAARFEVDPRRIYATGYSGGATYLGWYAPANATRFAAVVHVAGGVAYRPPCPDCKVPVLFVLGATDPMIAPYTRPLHDWYEGCGGHEIVWETLPGVTHESILQTLEAGRARRILAWLLARPAACAAATAPLDGGAEAGGPPDLARHDEDAGPADAAPVGKGSSPPPRVPPAAAGCACGRGEASAPAAGLGAAGLLGVVLMGRRRRDEEPLARRPPPR